MDLEAARKTLSKRGAFSLKRAAFLVVAGLCLVAGIPLRTGLYFGQPEGEEKAPVTVAAPPPSATPAPAVETTDSIPEAPPPTQEDLAAPNEAAEQASDAVEQAEQPGAPRSGIILVSKRPVEVLASPSSSAPAMYGFPAGRPFRVIGREGGFAQIQDLKSGASGWIDEAALALPPRAPSVSAPSQSKPAAVSRKPATASADPKPKATKKGSQVTAKKGSQVTADSEAAAEPDEVQTRKQPGLFGRGGPFGIFGGGN